MTSGNHLYFGALGVLYKNRICTHTHTHIYIYMYIYCFYITGNNNMTYLLASIHISNPLTDAMNFPIEFNHPLLKPEYLVAPFTNTDYLNIYPSMDKWYHRWRLGMDKYFHPTYYNGTDYLSRLGFKLNHVSKSGHIRFILMTWLLLP